ncbi:MAG: preprotein translocase subunit SecE [bacterium]
MQNPAKALTDYIKSSYEELKKVAWPNKQETTNHTLLVIGISLGMAAFLGLADYLFAYLLETLLR